jgi:hypothetical protein
MRWSRVSYANKISMAQMLVAGFKNFWHRFAKSGIDETYVKEIEDLTEKVLKLKQKQNRIRADLRATTVELQEGLKTLGKKVSRGRGMVKVELEQSLWNAFGITSKK